MPYTTLVAGTTITAAWGNANVRDQVVTPFASAAARTSAVSSPIDGMVTWLSDVDSLEVRGNGQWLALWPASATVLTSQTVTGASYVDLATVGPAVTLVTGTSALITLSANVKDSLADVAFMSFAVTGASSIAASDNNSISVVGTSSVSASATFKLAGLTAGSNTFTCKYRVVSGTGTYFNRFLTVLALP